MVFHRKQPRGMETSLHRANGLPSMGDGDRAYNSDQTHSGIFEAIQEAETQPSERTTTPHSTPRSSEGDRSPEPRLLQQGSPRRRLGRSRSLRPRTTSRQEIRPISSDRRHQSWYRHQRSRPNVLGAVGEVPPRIHRPSPEVNTETTSPTVGDGDVALGSEWPWQDSQSHDGLPGSLCDMRWPGPFWGLLWTEGDPDGRILRPRPEYPADEQVLARLENADEEQILQQDGELGQGLHNLECSAGDLLLDGATRAEDSLLPQNLLSD